MSEYYGFWFFVWRKKVYLLSGKGSVNRARRRIAYCPSVAMCVSCPPSPAYRDVTSELSIRVVSPMEPRVIMLLFSSVIATSPSQTIVIYYSLCQTLLTVSAFHFNMSAHKDGLHCH